MTPALTAYEYAAKSLMQPGRPVLLDQILRLEAAMHALPQSCKLSIPVEHGFAHRLYIRKARFQAGAVLIGEMHNFSHLSVLLSGRMITNIDGVMTVVDGPIDMIAQPGTKRVGIALTDVVWITAHGGPPDTQNIDDIEAWLVNTPRVDVCQHIEVTP